MRRYKKYYLTSIVILITAWLVNGQFASTPVNRWTRSSEMTVQRASACSVQLSDGKVLIAGGRNDAAVLNTAEVSNPDGTFTAVASMSQPRAGAACIALPNGRVLVTGGSDGNTNLASAEIYNSRNDTWTPVGEMSAARSGHNATRTPWGAILITGGEETGAVDMFLTNDTFMPLGMLSAGRTDPAIAATYNHKIIIAGGSRNGTAVRTVDIYDGDTGKIVPGGSLMMARRGFAAAPLVDGTVLITGGYGADGNLLDSTEIFDPEKGASSAGPTMSAARANHKVTVLPSNGRVLIVGGVTENGVTASTELYTPWTRKFSSVPAMHTARQQMVSTPLRRGAVVVAGGRGDNGNLSDSEIYGYATIDTDKDDYSPGEQATFTGTGWKPGEQVLLQVSAFPLDQHSVEYTAVTQADSTGRIRVTPFNIDRSHLGVRFLATATGSESQAQNVFTDAPEATTTQLNLSAPFGVFGVAVTPSGQVQGVATNPVSLGSVQVSVDGLAPYGVAQIPNNGGFTYASISSLNPGNHSFVAAYTGDGAIWDNSTSAATSYLVTDTTTTVITSLPAAVALGTPAALSATVTAAGGAPNPITGTVNFVNTYDRQLPHRHRPGWGGRHRQHHHQQSAQQYPDSVRRLPPSSPHGR